MLPATFVARWNRLPHKRDEIGRLALKVKWPVSLHLRDVLRRLWRNPLLGST